MSKSWIAVTARVTQGVQLVNLVDDKKFPLVLGRIAQFMQTSNGNGRPFSDEEEDKLLTTLSGVENKENLRLLLDTSTLIFVQAAYHVTKPAVMQKDLVEVLKMTEEKALTFQNIWASHAKLIIDNLRQRSINPMSQLDSFSWMLNVSVASNSENHTLEPRGIIELKLKDEEKGNVVLDMNQSQLYQLYDTLETIQSELDNLR